jgi:hypothetical protein
MSMRDWLWKVVEGLAGVAIVALIVVPTFIERTLFSALYAANPVFYIALLVAIVVLIGAALIHAAAERRKKAVRGNAASGSGTL